MDRVSLAWVCLEHALLESRRGLYTARQCNHVVMSAFFFLMNSFLLVSGILIMSGKAQVTHRGRITPNDTLLNLKSARAAVGPGMPTSGATR
jgi:hypothetical protein